jgi:hypothetical protein
MIRKADQEILADLGAKCFFAIDAFATERKHHLELQIQKFSP